MDDDDRLIKRLEKKLGFSSRKKAIARGCGVD
jgi:hypothetical protein